MKKILYVGASWASRSYDNPDGSETDFTSLYKELELEKFNVINLAFPGTSNQYFLDQLIYKDDPTGYKEHYDAIIWVYCEPLIELQIQQKMQEFLESENFWNMRSEANKKILDQIAQLDKPVALIGSASDIVDCAHKNITVIHPSWQKFLADIANVDLKYGGWAADAAHAELVTTYKNVVPSKGIVEAITEQFSAWRKLQYHRLFCWCHPNKKGNELFAKEIKNSVYSWIDNL